MTLTEEFWTTARSRHTQIYADDPTDGWMAREHNRLLLLAHSLGIPVLIRRSGNELRMAFESLTDSTALRLAAFGDAAEFGTHEHIEHFEPGQERERELGLTAVRVWAEQNNVACRVTRQGPDLRLKFERLSDFTRFSELRDAGVIAAAVAAVKRAGPEPSLN